eukprot:gene14271-28565_t
MLVTDVREATATEQNDLKRQNVLMLVTPKRVYPLHAPDEKEKDQWIDAIKKAVNGGGSEGVDSDDKPPSPDLPPMSGAPVIDEGADEATPALLACGVAALAFFCRDALLDAQHLVTEITLNRAGGTSLGILLAINPNEEQGGQVVAKLKDGGLAQLSGGFLPGDVITHINDVDVQ